MNVYDQLENKSVIYRVNEIFYEKVYKHPWLSLYFQDIDQKFITSQQTDYITSVIGGPKNFSGRLPNNAHTHMLITDELFDLRSQFLLEALDEANAPKELAETWKRIDDSFRNVIVKNSLSECKLRFKSDKLLAFENPDKKNVA